MSSRVHTHTHHHHHLLHHTCTTCRTHTFSLYNTQEVQTRINQRFDAESIRTSRRYNAARTFLERSSISKAFNFLNGRGIPTSEIIFLSPTRISKVPLRGRVEGSPRTQGYIDLGFVSILTFFLPAFTSFSILLARLLNAPQLLHASITTSNPESSFCDNETCEYKTCE